MVSLHFKSGLKIFALRTKPAGEREKENVGRKNEPTPLCPLLPQLHCGTHVFLVFSFADIDPPKNLRPSAVTQSGGVLTWAPPDAPIDGYILTYQFPDGTAKVLATHTCLGM